MTMTELKAKAYDILANIQFLQQELNNLNEQIRIKAEEETKDDSTSER